MLVVSFRSPRRRQSRCAGHPANDVVGSDGLVVRRLFHVVDDKHVDRRFDRVHLQPQLLLDCGEQIREGLGIRIGRR